MADKWTDARLFRPDTFGSDAAPHTPADADLPINVKAVVCSDNGTLSFKNAAGTARTSFPVVAGVPLLFVPARITAVSAGTCWLVF